MNGALSQFGLMTGGPGFMDLYSMEDQLGFCSVEPDVEDIAWEGGGAPVAQAVGDPEEDSGAQAAQAASANLLEIVDKAGVPGLSVSSVAARFLYTGVGDETVGFDFRALPGTLRQRLERGSGNEQFDLLHELAEGEQTDSHVTDDDARMGWGYRLLYGTSLATIPVSLGLLTGNWLIFGASVVWGLGIDITLGVWGINAISKSFMTLMTRREQRQVQTAAKAVLAHYEDADRQLTVFRNHPDQFLRFVRDYFPQWLLGRKHSLELARQSLASKLEMLEGKLSDPALEKMAAATKAVQQARIQRGMGKLGAEIGKLGKLIEALEDLIASVNTQATNIAGIIEAAQSVEQFGEELNYLLAEVEEEGEASRLERENLVQTIGDTMTMIEDALRDIRATVSTRQELEGEEVVSRYISGGG